VSRTLDNAQCVAVLQAMADNPKITDSEMEFVEKHHAQRKFTDQQREHIARFAAKYPIE
jgi:hypothetical protein